MAEGYNFRQLQQRILELSVAQEWDVARKEWVLIEVYEASDPEQCLCGHFPIIEICTIQNRSSGKQAEVGNRCVRRFLGFRSDLIFKALKKIREDASKSLNADAIAFFNTRGLFSGWEYGFLQNTMKKRNLSYDQLRVRKEINAKVLAAIKRRGFRGPD